ASNDNTDDGALNWTDITGAGTLAPGAFIDVTVNMTAKASTQALVNDQTINTGTVTGATDENGDTAPTDSDTEPVEIGNPQVSVVKTLITPAGGVTVVNGQVQWRIRVTNNGDTILNTVPLADTYDTTYLTYGFSGSFSSPASNDNTDDGTLNWTDITGAGTLAPGAFADVIVNMTAKASTQALVNDQTINTGTVTGATDENGETVPTDSDTEPVEIAEPGVQIVKILQTPADGIAFVGDPVSFDIVVTNSGDTALTTVVLTDTFDTAFLSFNNASSAPNSTTPAGTLTWNNIGSIAANTSVTITVNFTAIASTLGEPNDETINFTGVSQVEDENANQLPDEQAQEPVQIFKPGAIGDYLWYDVNEDGIQDVTEPGIGNVTIQLLDDNTAAVLATTQTDSDGGYLFPGLLPGDYRVVVTDANGILSGLGLVPSPGPQSQISPFVVNLSPEEIERDADFGYTDQSDPDKAVIGDTVWIDQNQNGIVDPGEPGLPGVVVELVDATTNTPTGIQATTDANGMYLMINVPPGTYYVQTVSGVPSGATPSTGAPDPTDTFVVGPGDKYLDADIGFVLDEPGTIGDLIWIDLSPFNGVKDVSESGVAGVSVSLINVTTGNTIATDTTDGNGNYSFAGLLPGVYQVRVTDTQYVLADYEPTILGAPNTNNNSQSLPYNVPPGATASAPFTVLYADFGFKRSGPGGDGDPDGVIGNQVFYDVDGDGVYNPAAGDTGIAGVTVELLNAAGTIVITSTITGASGDYVFTSLPTGTYRVRVSDPLGILDGYVDTKFPVNQTADNNNKIQSYSVTLPTPGSFNMTADFGYTRPSAIGDFVWYDANNDGVQDVGEPGIPNVTLQLWDAGINGVPGGGDDVLVDNTVTDADGGYLFDDVEPGTYFVRVTDTNDKLDGLTPTTGPQAQPHPDSNPVVITPGTVEKDVDFGYVLTPGGGNAIIGDTVFFDGNNDGIQQPGEPGATGITVCATPVGGGAPICAITDANGRYFIEVPAGNYNVAPSPGPAGYAPTTPVPQAVSVAAGEQYLDADFGYFNDSLLGEIGNLVWDDLDKDGIVDVGEPGIAGVSVVLIRELTGSVNGQWDPGEPIIATDTTDTNGLYQFTGVRAGNYLVHVSDTNSVLLDYIKSPNGPAGDNTSKPDPYQVILAANGSNQTADFGFYKVNRPEIGYLGNQVWTELDYDGVFEENNVGSTDKGQAGVTVDLYRNGVYYATTTTGASGDYAFLALPSGVYTVTVTDTANVLAIYSPTTFPANQTADNNNKVQPYSITLPVAGENMTADFGYIAFVTLGDMAYFDTNGNGIQDGGETTGVPNVPITATNLSLGLVFTTVTDATGIYTFTDIPPGQYQISSPTTVGILQRTTPAGSLLRYVPPGTTDLNFDIGYIPPTAVEIVQMTANVGLDGVTLAWMTSSEEPGDGFYIYRAISETAERTLLTPEAIPVIGSPTGSGYEYLDASATPGEVYYYWLVTDPQGVEYGPIIAAYLTPGSGKPIYIPLVVR
ncbi:MAG: carboxypeptidase regulatory-like domain-containing protein, partial [Caldilineales bacterium]|nr:carboxypeptidase regulatory-like domain-containing protein [Caldilineales bacterium]